jgi:stage II sporulation protein AB (anti-sigma F factor)
MKDKIERNEMTLEFDSISQNESFARTVVAAFATQLDPTIEELADIKTAVSEAVTNCIIHGYYNSVGIIRMHCVINRNELLVEIQDRGIGIDDIEKAMEPLYTTRPELERSGMGFSFMEAFMDELEVESELGRGTLVRMIKRVGRQEKLKELAQETGQKV